MWETAKLPRSQVLLFQLIQLLFGVNYGFFATVQNKKIRVLANAVSMLLCTINLITATWTLFPRFEDVSLIFWVLMTTFYLYLLIVLRFSTYTFYDFCKDLSNIDVKFCIKESDSYVILLTFVIVAIEILYQIGMFLSNWFQNKFFDMEWTMLMFPVLVMNITVGIQPLVQSLIFCHVYIRIKTLKLKLEKRQFRALHAKRIFKSVADCLAKIRLNYDNVTAVRFIVSATVLVFTVGHEIAFLTKSAKFFDQVTFIFETLHTTLRVFLPAILAEMVSVQIDGLKLVLHEQLLFETDDDVSKDLVGLLRYVEARPLLHKAWRLVPVDLRQPLMLLNICVTYIIVYLQFTHVY